MNKKIQTGRMGDLLRNSDKTPRLMHIGAFIRRGFSNDWNIFSRRE